MAATAGRSTGYAQTSVTNVSLPGTQVLNVSDPVGDDNGPGTYQYPTNSSFAPGGFDLTGLRVNETGTERIHSDVHSQPRPDVRQLVRGAVAGPLRQRSSATSTSTSAAYPQLNYSITPDDAWSERLEAQGFAPTIWVNAAGTSLGSVQQVVDDASGTITLIVPQSVFGTVGSGWVFTVTLAGQNGVNSYQARDFTATPGAYTFGVCAAGGTNPICSVNPSSVPYVIDTITPPSVSQDTELDPTLGPVVLTGVTVP